MLILCYGLCRVIKIIGNSGNAVSEDGYLQDAVTDDVRLFIVLEQSRRISEQQSSVGGLDVAVAVSVGSYKSVRVGYAQSCVFTKNMLF